MTRDELIEAIVTEVVSASQGPDFGTGISGQEFAFQNMVGRITRKQKRKQMGFKNPGIHEMDESMAELHRVAKNSAAVKYLKKSFHKNVKRPLVGTRRALRYREAAHQQAAHGRWDRSLTMQRRANAVIDKHAPALIGAGVGATAGFLSMVPGGTEVGSILGSKGGRVAQRISNKVKVARARA